MSSSESDGLHLVDGSKIAIVGGGPAGSFFTYFALDFADRIGMDIHVDIYEAKDFNCAGPSGCNHCGGIVSESLVQMLATEGIVLPPRVIRRGIESYTMHLESGLTTIDTPFHDQRIASVYRGFGPRSATDKEHTSFDGYLNELCESKGARVLYERVSELIREENGVLVKTKQGSEQSYDLVVGASGLNSSTLSLFKSINRDYIPPKTTKTFICEFHLKSDVIDEYFGNSMHVFLLNLPHVKFGALIPKKNFVTLVMLGSEINQKIVKDFIHSNSVRKCFPPETDLDAIAPCQCYPSINIRGAQSAFDDRMVVIGDSGTSKLYKNGIGAAYIAAKSAARTAVFTGISKNDFEKNYGKVCKELEFDNLVGKFIFLVTTIIQRSNFLKNGLLRQIRYEQRLSNHQRRMSSVLWDTFSGSAGYRNILIRTIHPIVLISLIWNILASLFTKK
jgi:flavin-dependent dehydrogenase